MKNFLKKFLFFLGIIAAVSATTNFTTATPVFARDYGSCDALLGMVPWDCNAPEINSQDNLVSAIVVIATNVLTDISVLASYLVLFYVMYGGFLYMSSSGDPGKAMSGKKTLIHAFIGLAIVISAYTIFSAIRIAIAGNSGFDNCIGLKDPNIDANCANGTNIVANLISWLGGIAGVVSAIFILVGAWGYITAAGDPGKLQKAKQTILYAIIGLVIFALAQIITAFVSQTVRNANAYVNHSTIANLNKESYENQNPT